MRALCVDCFFPLQFLCRVHYVSILSMDIRRDKNLKNPCSTVTATSKLSKSRGVNIWISDGGIALRHIHMDIATQRLETY